MDENLKAPQENTPQVQTAENNEAQAPVVPASVEASTPGANVPRQFDKTFTELQAIQNTVRKFKPEDLVVPLLSIVSLALLTIFVYIPMITSGIDFRAEGKEVQAKVDQLTKLNTDLDSVDVTLLQTDLSNARSVIPFSLQVSDFVSYIDDAAKSNNLEFREILAGDIVVRNNNDTKGIDPVMRGVSGPLKYYGNLDQINLFLDQIQDASPFIVSADQVQLKKTQTEGKWEIALTITGYYINQSSLPKGNIYAPFTNYTQYTPILEVFKTKAEKLKQ